MLIIDHDMTLVRDVADQITVLNFGRRIADGPAAAVLREPAVIAAYLGEDALPSAGVGLKPGDAGLKALPSGLAPA